MDGRVTCPENARVVTIDKFKDEDEGSVFRELYDLTLEKLNLSGELTLEEVALVNRVLSARALSDIELTFFEGDERVGEILNARDTLLGYKDNKKEQYDELIDLYGSEGAAILQLSLRTSDDWKPGNAIEELLNAVDISQTLAAGVGGLGGTVDGTITGAIDTVKLVGGIILSPSESYDRAKEILKYVKENPKEFFENASEEVIASVRNLQSDLAKYDYAIAIGDRTQIFNTSYAVGESIGPFFVGLGAGGLVLKSPRIANIVNTIVRTGKRPDTPDVDTPNSNGGNGGDDIGNYGGDIGGGGAAGNNFNNNLPDGPAQLQHIFRDDIGHLLDTPTNRKLLLDTSNNPANKLGTNRFGNNVHVTNRADGSQIWVETRNGIIQNGGVNNPPRTWVPGEGLR